MHKFFLMVFIIVFLAMDAGKSWAESADFLKLRRSALASQCAACHGYGSFEKEKVKGVNVAQIPVDVLLSSLAWHSSDPESRSIVNQNVRGLTSDQLYQLSVLFSEQWESKNEK